MRKIIGFIVTAGHLDIEWYQPLRSYRFWTVEALEDLKRISQTRDDFKTYCLDGQYYPLKEYLGVVPEDEAAMRALVEKGLLTIGPFFTQFDEWLPSAESMIRNCLYGERLCKKFGGYMQAGYLPDNFGHPMQLPQILKGFDIDSLLFMRGMPEVPGGHDDEFIYKGLDGSEIFVSHFRESYSGAFDIFNKPILPSQPREVPYYADYLSFEHHRELADHDDPERIARSLIDNIHRIKDRYPTKIIPLIAGYDHLPPQINIGDSVKAANAMQDEIEFVMGDVEEYVRLATSKLNENAPCQRYDMELIGSMYQYVLLGALSTRTYLKRENFACEVLLEKYAEPLDAMASLYGYPHKPALLDEAWEFMMINSAHDSIHGSSVDEVHVEMQARFGGVRQIAAGIIHDALKFAGRQMSPWGEKDQEILALSPTTAQNQTVELWLPVNEAVPEDRAGFGAFSQASQLRRRKIAIADTAGRILKTQIVNREPIALNGKGQPRNSEFPGKVFEKVLFTDDFQAYALKKYRIVETDEFCTGDLKADDTSIENSLIRVECAGALINIWDKRSGFAAHCLNLLEEDADAGDAWDYSPTWTPGEIVRSSQFPFTSRLKEAGNVRAVLEISGSMSVPHHLNGDARSPERSIIPVVFEVTVYSGSPRVEVRLTLDNTARDHRIRLRIPSAVKTDFVRSQGHLAILDRPIDRQKEIDPWLQPPTQLLPCREWLAVEDKKHGLAIALKGMYDYEAIMNPLNGHPDLCITLLRSFELMSRLHTLQREGDAAMAVPTPGAQCPGKQVMEWAYVLYDASAHEKAPFLPEVQSFLYPPVGHAIRAAHESARMDAASVPFSVDADNIQFSAFKKCYDHDGYILRLYENQGKATQAHVKLSPVFTGAALANMNERDIGPLSIVDGEIVLDFQPYKAITIKLTCM